MTKLLNMHFSKYIPVIKGHIMANTDEQELESKVKVILHFCGVFSFVLFSMSLMKPFYPSLPINVKTKFMKEMN